MSTECAPTRRKHLKALLSGAEFLLVLAPVLLGPWLFGAWEAWWFWPFALCIFLAAVFFGLSRACSLDRLCSEAGGAVNPEAAADARARQFLLWSFAPFLVYAVARAARAPVVMDAERSLLLHLTPFLLGVVIVCGFSRRQRAGLWVLLLVNLALLAAYGFVNHRLTGNRKVLWMDAYPYYLDNRMTGSYYCPDHFAGAMEIAVALGLALLLTRDLRRPVRLAGSLLALACAAGVVLSKSRGGGLALLGILVAAPIWGFGQWPRGQRWWWRTSAVAATVLGLTLFARHAHGYMDRFAAEFGWKRGRPQSWESLRPELVRHLKDSSRGRMAAAAVRAWRQSPVWGIGPGMHQNVWPHVSASADGDPARARWPTQVNNQWYSFEVHNDWLQLLEEYGAVGFSLFLLPVLAVGVTMLRGLRKESQARRLAHWHRTGRRSHAPLLGGLLACVALAVHSCGDFNLQIPGTNWMFAAVVALACAAATAAAPERRPAGNGSRAAVDPREESGWPPAPRPDGGRGES